jgi:predicted TPR repeat methyltransferase
VTTVAGWTYAAAMSGAQDDRGAPDNAIDITPWTGRWSDDDPDANFKADVALYAHADPLRTLRGLSASTGVPVGALARYVLARWASEGASGLLELGPTMTRRLHDVCEQAEAAASDEARLAAFHQLRQMISWLHFPLERPEVYEGAVDRVQRARSLYGTDEVRTFYDRWAVTYDRDVVDELGFVGAERVVDAVIGHLAPNSALLDLGCGTGAVGDALSRRVVAGGGSHVIDGTDVSPGMLKVAAYKSTYRCLTERDLNAVDAMSDVADGSYDAVVSAGAFVGGHVRAEFLREATRVVRRGGVMAFTVNLDYWHTSGMEQIVNALVAEEVLTQLGNERVAATDKAGMSDTGGHVQLVVLRRM